MTCTGACTSYLGMGECSVALPEGCISLHGQEQQTKCSFLHVPSQCLLICAAYHRMLCIHLGVKGQGEGYHILQQLSFSGFLWKLSVSLCIPYFPFGLTRLFLRTGLITACNATLFVDSCWHGTYMLIGFHSAVCAVCWSQVPKTCSLLMCPCLTSFDRWFK